MKMRCVWLLSAVILTTAVPAWPDTIGVHAQTQVILPDGKSVSGDCFCTTSPQSFSSSLTDLSGSGSSTASASFGMLDAASTASSPSGNFHATSANSLASFTDSFTVLNGGTGTFTIAFVSTGTAASASGNADSDVSVNMQVINGATQLGANFIVSSNPLNDVGLPINVFTVDVSDGDTVSFNASVFADSTAGGIGGGGTASATDPMSVFITAPSGLTFSTGSGASYTPPVSPAPEPNSLLLISSGLVSLGLICRRKPLKRL